MAWITTATDAATTLTVEKTVEGVNIPGYPKVYSPLEAFGETPSMTTNAWQKLEPTPRAARLSAFTAWVEKAEHTSVAATQTNEPYRESATPPGEIVEA